MLTRDPPGLQLREYELGAWQPPACRSSAQPLCMRVLYASSSVRVRASGLVPLRTVYSPQAGKDAYVHDLLRRAKTAEDRMKVRSLVT